MADGEADARFVQGAQDLAEEGEDLGLAFRDDGIEAEAAGQTQHQG
jgi:hypothetical protein